MPTSKDLLRQEFRAARKRMAPEERVASSRAIVARVAESPFYQRAESILAYWSLPHEVDLRELIADALLRGKRVALPRCGKGAATFEAVEIRDPATELAPGPFPGLRQPLAASPAWPIATPFDLALVPGVAFDRRGTRLGFGAGMYDRFFARQSVDALLGIAFSLQIAEDLPAESHDRPMDAIATESEWIEIDQR